MRQEIFAAAVSTRPLKAGGAQKGKHVKLVKLVESHAIQTRVYLVNIIHKKKYYNLFAYFTININI